MMICKSIHEIFVNKVFSDNTQALPKFHDYCHSDLNKHFLYSVPADGIKQKQTLF